MKHAGPSTSHLVRLPNKDLSRNPRRNTSCLVSLLTTQTRLILASSRLLSNRAVSSDVPQQTHLIFGSSSRISTRTSSLHVSQHKSVSFSSCLVSFLEISHVLSRRNFNVSCEALRKRDVNVILCGGADHIFLYDSPNPTLGYHKQLQ